MSFQMYRQSVQTLFLILISAISYHHGLGQNEKLLIKAANIKDLELPALKKGETIIRHSGFSLCYNEEYEQANWVAYELTAQETIGKYKRTNKFLTDPKVSTGTSDNLDFLKSNYDRGHLAPAGDMGWSAKSMAESFYYSNMSPQVPTFNRGIWEHAEELVRGWAKTYASVYVVSGPVLTKGLKRIGPNKVAVPQYYYKVILDYKDSESKGIGLVLKNGDDNGKLKDHFVTIDSVERMTGIDFFPSLPDNLEQTIESKAKVSDWQMKAGEDTGKGLAADQKKSGTAAAPGALARSVQCTAVTQKGSRCKKMTINANRRCHLHQ